MFVRKAALDLPSPPVAIAQQFQLTPAELRVLFSIVEIGGVSGGCRCTRDFGGDGQNSPAPPV
jgi:hypothetical protein